MFFAFIFSQKCGFTFKYVFTVSYCKVFNKTLKLKKFIKSFLHYIHKNAVMYA